MFKVIWDKENNGVRLTMSRSSEALNVAPRPVFFEELDFFGLHNQGWSYPRCPEPLLWACERRYFYKGELVLELKGGDIFTQPTISFVSTNLNIDKAIDIKTLRKFNEDTIFLLEHEAMSFIFKEAAKYLSLERLLKVNPEIDFQQLAEQITEKTKKEHVVVKEDCDSFDIMPIEEAEAQGRTIAPKQKVDKFVVSFSGGKDSQVVLDLVARTLPSSEFIVIYSDTGYELSSSMDLYNETRNFYAKTTPGIQFHIAHNQQPLMVYWDKLGAPSRMQRWCCSVMKSAPLTKLLKNIINNGKQPKAILFDGVRAEESVNRATRKRIGYSVKHTNIINVSLILQWNATEIYLYILLRGLPFNEAYRKGFSRVGCVICPYSSKWSEFLSAKIYPRAMAPFINNIRNSLQIAKIAGIEEYIKDGKWKERAGGRTVDCECCVSFVEDDSSFKAVIKRPREDFLTWINVLGEVKGYTEKSIFKGTIKFQDRLLSLKLNYKENNTTEIEIEKVNRDPILISYLKKIIYKTVYCVHCEVCEANCPTGALSVTPNVSIDINKCVHCLKCINFDGKGCVSASSVSISSGEKKNMVTTIKSGINRYNDGMGLREVWLKRYFGNAETFFDNDSHGLNPRYQLPPFTNWIREANILNTENKTISVLGETLRSIYHDHKNIVWEVIIINLSENSEVCKWYTQVVEFNHDYTKTELEALIQLSYPDLKDRTLKNPLNSLLNTFKESPLGSTIPIGRHSTLLRKPIVTRLPYEDLSLQGLAYSLYRYGEVQNRKSLTISELMAEDQTAGPIKVFGISRETLENGLRALDEANILKADLKMGLDNINLRHDLNALEALKMAIEQI